MTDSPFTHDIKMQFSSDSQEPLQKTTEHEHDEQGRKQTHDKCRPTTWDSSSPANMAKGSFQVHPIKLVISYPAKCFQTFSNSTKSGNIVSVTFNFMSSLTVSIKPLYFWPCVSFRYNAHNL